MTDGPPTLDRPPLHYAIPEPSGIDRNLLSAVVITHWVMAVLYIVLSATPLSFLVYGILMVSGRVPGTSPSPSQNPGWWLVGCCGAIALPSIVIAALTLASSFQIRRRKYWTFSIVVAAVNCCYFPFGAALAIFTIIVLTRRSVEALYRSAAK